MQRFQDISSYPPITGKFQDYQKEMQGQWARTPNEGENPLAAMHVANMKRVGKTTVTELNPLDPGDESVPGYGDVPHDSGRITRGVRF